MSSAIEAVARIIDPYANWDRAQFDDSKYQQDREIALTKAREILALQDERIRGLVQALEWIARVSDRAIASKAVAEGRLDVIGDRAREALASADTRPEGGDANAAPFTSGAAPKADAQTSTAQTPEPTPDRACDR